MTLFLPPIRRFHIVSGAAPATYPAPVAAAVTLGPGDAFGVPIDLRTTVGLPNTASLSGNFDDGSIELSGELIQKLEADFQLDRFRIRVDGNILTLSFDAASYDEARQTVNSAIQLLPPILTRRLQVYVWVKRCEVTIGEERSTFVLSKSQYLVTATTRERNTDFLRESIAEWLSTTKDHLSLVSALYYLRQAKRLAAIQPCPEPFVSEIVLNLAKAIEIVFRPKGPKPHDHLRARAREWNCDPGEVEHFLIPILILRNEVDGAHAALTQLTAEQRSTVIDFSVSAIRHVEMLLHHVVTHVRSSAIRLEGLSTSLKKDKATFLKRIAEYLALARKKGEG